MILLTVPLALAGALLALWYFDQTLNIFSQIGLIMLVGLVTKNGILIVEFANQRRAAGAHDALAAVHEAAAARLRPILMTTLATILGILPIALALGAGAESRMSMGIAVIGGLRVRRRADVVRDSGDVRARQPPRDAARGGCCTRARTVHGASAGDARPSVRGPRRAQCATADSAGLGRPSAFGAAGGNARPRPRGCR